MYMTKLQLKNLIKECINEIGFNNPPINDNDKKMGIKELYELFMECNEMRQGGIKIEFDGMRITLSLGRGSNDNLGGGANFYMEITERGSDRFYLEYGDRRGIKMKPKDFSDLSLDRLFDIMIRIFGRMGIVLNKPYNDSEELN